MDLNVAVIGQQGHIPAVLAGVDRVEGARLLAWATALETEDANELERRRERWGELTIYDDFRKMLDTEPIDIVVIGTQHDRHAALCIECAERRKHVICEKPVALYMEELAALKSAVNENNVSLAAMFNLRSKPAFQAARRAVQLGRIGEPILVTAQKSYKFGKRRPDFYKDRQTFGGTIPWVAIHAIDFMRWTAGIELIKLVAMHSNMTRPDYPGLEDNGCILFGMANGGTACLNMDYLRPEAAASHGDDRLRIAGSEGILEIKDCGQRLELIAKDGVTEEMPLPGPGSLFVDFAAGLADRNAPRVTNEDVFRVTELALKARDSADGGGVPLDLPLD